jgi:hypothetical protein
MVTKPMEQESGLKRIRLSDRILYALDLALQQEDVYISEMLVKALEVAMTRNTGGGEFIERRDYPPEMEDALNRLADIKAKLAAKKK